MPEPALPLKTLSLPATGAAETPNADAIRQEWDQVIQTVIAVFRGNQSATFHLAPFLDLLEQQVEWQPLAIVLRHLLAGERDPAVLLPGLDATSTLIVTAILDSLNRQDEEEARPPGLALND